MEIIYTFADHRFFFFFIFLMLMSSGLISNLSYCLNEMGEPNGIPFCRRSYYPHRFCRLLFKGLWERCLEAWNYTDSPIRWWPSVSLSTYFHIRHYLHGTRKEFSDCPWALNTMASSGKRSKSFRWLHFTNLLVSWTQNQLLLVQYLLNKNEFIISRSSDKLCILIFYYLL